MMIWKLTLEPRDIELLFGANRGFFTKVMGPIALRVNQESRNTVKPLYPLCFGNVVYEPQVLFNFSFDTLLLERAIQPQVLHLLASLKPDEMTQLRYLAVDSLINIDFEDGEYMDIDTENLIRKVVPAMTALKEIRLILNLAWFPEPDIEHPSGDGPMQLYDDKWPTFLQNFHVEMCVCECLCSGVESDDDSNCGECGHGCTCMEVPPVERDWARLEGPTVRNAWGWRPVYFDY
jgi:hypothetical protein